MKESAYDDIRHCKYSEWQEVKLEKDTGARYSKTLTPMLKSWDFIQMAAHGHWRPLRMIKFECSKLAWAWSGE